MYAAFEAYNPFRSPSWRYDRVLKLVGHRPRPLKASRAHDDDTVKTYRDFLLRMRNRESREAELGLFVENPSLFLANTIINHPDHEWRSILHARVLARQSDEEIAQWASTLPEAVSWYNELCFDVRDRLESRGYIIKVIVGRPDDRRPSHDGSMTEFQRELCYKMFGYFGGPLVLEAVVAGMSEGTFPYRPADVPAFVDNAIAQIVRNRTAMAARTMAVNRYTLPTLFTTYAQILTITKQVAEGGGAPSDVKQNVEAMLGEMRWSVGRTGHLKKTSLEQAYDMTAVEPRADEAMELAKGREPDSLRDIKDLQLRLAVEKEHGQAVQ
jgi:hypothetical protein